jgi:nitrogen regulatory protein P-II 1
VKKIEAIIRPCNLEAVKEALARRGIEGMTVSEVTGFDRNTRRALQYRSAQYTVDCLPKIKIELLVADDAWAGPVVEAIKTAAHTDHLGDGQIVVVPIDEVVRIRTGERGPDAI